MTTAPTYALSSRTPKWALDPYRFPGLQGLDADDDTDRPDERPVPPHADEPPGNAR
ncbi:hypothetical protein [Streptomyces sp. NPDC058623]|uniref:hypothetical protein n=1 Tax=Streptomyces sp. NPDC058623 TaxID=3346563 RepID=UPI0036521ADF